MPHNRLLLIRFENIIVLDEFEPFRRATVNELKDKDILFHNHLPDGMEFRHPFLLYSIKSCNIMSLPSSSPMSPFPIMWVWEREPAWDTG